MAQDWSWAINLFNEDDIKELGKLGEELIYEDEEEVSVVLNFTTSQSKEIVDAYYHSRLNRNPLAAAYTEAFLHSVISMLKEFLEERGKR